MEHTRPSPRQNQTQEGEFALSIASYYFMRVSSLLNIYECSVVLSHGYARRFLGNITGLAPYSDLCIPGNTQIYVLLSINTTRPNTLLCPGVNNVVKTAVYAKILTKNQYTTSLRC